MDKYEYRFNPMKSRYELKPSNIRADFYRAEEVEKELKQRDKKIEQLKKELREAYLSLSFSKGNEQ